MNLIEKIESTQLRKDIPFFSRGDFVTVMTKVVEGEKERIQSFSGIVISRKGRGINESFIVRKISYGEGIERNFKLHSPAIEKIIVEKKAPKVRRARLYYLRKQKGKEAMLGMKK
ncbi:50S ribosomal protein L19 [Methylacidiphilum kamchatkense Kam1]|uniref:Large ribosomal subunit protein bL19 n=1 Tax=Methylacidiphilum kamchatkense Kam1 TaxID=1202785 RepID=A0A0C1RS81_9BACT|nr:50S ribosomal protein L19 [Methylacidiphilum kamchatkense]KIE57766.1 50S ribosomal protein L19 [Methylacidiphilum kamchatkense Kam1]QDQ42489.1 LSU ribosomal protein L19P [Methylacidiphilum kamchatkense Kam1]